MSGCTSKEQHSKCRCIVNERIMDDPNSPRPGEGGDCTEVYRKLGSCLNQCLKQKCREYAKRNGKSSSSCDW